MKWILKLKGVFELEPENNYTSNDMSQKFIDSFNHIGEKLCAKYDCTLVEGGVFEFVADIDFIFESDYTKEDAIAEFMEELEYIGEATTLDYVITPCYCSDKYTATYLVYMEDRADFDTTVGPYKDVESLKAQTMEVLTNIIGISGASDGEYPVDATIEKDGKWYDSDSFIAVYKDGKVIQIKEG